MIINNQVINDSDICKVWNVQKKYRFKFVIPLQWGWWWIGKFNDGEFSLPTMEEVTMSIKAYSTMMLFDLKPLVIYLKKFIVAELGRVFIFLIMVFVIWIRVEDFQIVL